jgi:hypothetical protein
MLDSGREPPGNWNYEIWNHGLYTKLHTNLYTKLYTNLDTSLYTNLESGHKSVRIFGHGYTKQRETTWI